MSLIVGAVEDVAAWQRACTEGAECDVLDADSRLLEGLEPPAGGAALPLMATLPAGIGGEELRAFLDAWAPSLKYLRVRLGDIARLKRTLDGIGCELVAQVDNDGVPRLRDLAADEIFAGNLGARHILVCYRPRRVADLDVGANFIAQARLGASVCCRGRLGAAARVLFAGGGGEMSWGAVGAAPDSEGRVSVRILRELELQVAACA